MNKKPLSDLAGCEVRLPDSANLRDTHTHSMFLLLFKMTIPRIICKGEEEKKCSGAKELSRDFFINKISKFLF